MSRSGYVDDMDDQWALIRWRGAVASAIRGMRGQAFLKEMLASLDALPEKKLIAHELVDASGAVCALGAVAKSRGCLSSVVMIDPEYYEGIAPTFDIAEALAREVVYENDEGGCYWGETPEQRFKRVRQWVCSNIVHSELVTP